MALVETYFSYLLPLIKVIFHVFEVSIIYFFSFIIFNMNLTYCVISTRPIQDLELLSTIDEAKNKENMICCHCWWHYFVLAWPFIGEFDDLRKDSVGNNLNWALNNISSNDLFVELNSVPSISLLLDYFEILENKDHDSILTFFFTFNNLLASSSSSWIHGSGGGPARDSDAPIKTYSIQFQVKKDQSLTLAFDEVPKD